MESTILNSKIEEKNEKRTVDSILREFCPEKSCDGLG